MNDVLIPTKISVQLKSFNYILLFILSGLHLLLVPLPVPQPELSYQLKSSKGLGGVCFLNGIAIDTGVSIRESCPDEFSTSVKIAILL